jgi:hypothetical protein
MKQLNSLEDIATQLIENTPDEEAESEFARENYLTDVEFAINEELKDEVANGIQPHLVGQG